MSFFADLTTHSYTNRQAEPGVLNVGWLGEGEAFPSGDTPANFRERLAELCAHPILLHRGTHVCEFCRNASGNGQVRVRDAQGVWYSAPTMIHHYVTEHRYLPPADFIEAVLHPSDDSRAEGIV